MSTTANCTPDWTTGAPALLVFSCSCCGHRWYLPRSRCPACGQQHIHTSNSAGAGTVAAATRVVRSDGADVGIVLVDLDDGVRVMGLADGEINIGERVSMSFDARPPQPWFGREAADIV